MHEGSQGSVRSFIKVGQNLWQKKKRERWGFFTAWLQCKSSFSLVKSSLCLKGAGSSNTWRDDLDQDSTDYESDVIKS